MAAGLSVDHDVVKWMQERLDAASPDLLREMVKTFAEALMAGVSELLCKGVTSTMSRGSGLERTRHDGSTGRGRRHCRGGQAAT
jgi:hypothetical protein